MYCPRCATANLDNARFCRACGADISLVPQAMTGHLSRETHGASEVEDESRGRKRRRRREKAPPSLEGVLKNVFTGIAFMLIFVVGLLFFRRDFILFFWAIIPGLACIGEAIGQYIRLNQERAALAPPSYAQPSMAMPPPTRASALPPPDTSEIIAPPSSVTEGTTRHLGVRRERME
ncbi:MAG TPA: zinc ribbon domain-containing protein [Pyrinomonadaceae bacterium]